MSEAPELLAHLFGDYVVQSDYAAVEKTRRALPAAIHAATYTACFLPLTRSPRALAVIGGTHYLIDRYRLAKYVGWAKNQAAPARWRHSWDRHVEITGYHRDGSWIMDDCNSQIKPDWMAVWLMIVTDNTLHIAINRWALRRLG